MRAGYNADRIPLSLFNSRQEPVGFDVDLAGLLARDIGVTLELVPFTRHGMAQQLSAGTVDIIPSLAYNTAWIGDIRFSIPYYDAVLGLAVKDAPRAVRVAGIDRKTRQADYRSAG